MARIWTAVLVSTSSTNEKQETLAKDAVKDGLYRDSNDRLLKATCQPSKKKPGAFLFLAIDEVDGKRIGDGALPIDGDEVLTPPAGGAAPERLADTSLPNLKAKMKADGRYEVHRYTVQGQEGLVAFASGKLKPDYQTGEGFYNVAGGEVKKERA